MMAATIKRSHRPELNNATSITHEHLLAIITTECKSRKLSQILRVLDVGCGNGLLIAYLHELLPRLNPGTRFEIFGLDVVDHGVQASGYFGRTVEMLTSRFPDVDWLDRLTLTCVDCDWPYDNGFFDVIVSNQVCEHVSDHDHFFAQIRRTLRTGGFSVHLFPLVNCLWEGHLELPFVHWIRHWDLLNAYIKLLSRLGLGAFRTHRRLFGSSLDDYARRHADYVHYCTNYISYGQALRLAKRTRMRASFRYTQEFYRRRLRSLLGMTPEFEYRAERSAAADWCSSFFLKYVSSITLFLEKLETYAQAADGRPLSS
ncbi:MAG: hypothetical protein H6Q06_394 [Acidobacteria bacterium]|nr:hypothetical protein [Acidobacteriota bacterium]